ncbi:hypothetical protein [Streptomyces sp. DSM 40750]|uniref:hypothetical protein n=1 Tax=Streptomyces sp. DSM 40750 TaxID=2801030 RepID=UPI00214B3871|nr:hypothetical protein [Streptomyces sp. DSM 40750]UUU20258.1 hypothetical protein JIX55_08025 [Streptomyces sp. DSM 40750]
MLIVLAVIIALGAVAAVVLVATGGEGAPDEKPPGETGRSKSPTPTPSLSLPSRLPSDLPSLPSDLPGELPSGFPSDLDSLFPAPVGDEVPYEMLQTDDCFYTDAGRPGRATPRSCGEPHDAEVVEVAELRGSFAGDAAPKEAASALCEETLERKAAEQPADTVRGTLVRCPASSGYDIGIDNVACGLSADVDGERKLTKPPA